MLAELQPLSLWWSTALGRIAPLVLEPVPDRESDCDDQSERLEGEVDDASLAISGGMGEVRGKRT